MEKQIMWAVYGPDGEAIADTLSFKEVTSIIRWEKGAPYRWSFAMSRGYSCREVEVTIKPKP